MLQHIRSDWSAITRSSQEHRPSWWIWHHNIFLFMNTYTCIWLYTLSSGLQFRNDMQNHICKTQRYINLVIIQKKSIFLMWQESPVSLLYIILDFYRRKSRNSEVRMTYYEYTNINTRIWLWIAIKLTNTHSVGLANLMTSYTG